MNGYTAPQSISDSGSHVFCGDIFERLQIAPLGQPVLMLAPLHGIGTPLFRNLYEELGGMDFLSGGFVRITGATQTVPAPVRHKLPLLIQLLATKPEDLFACVRLQKERGVWSDSDWLDFNAGCPARQVNSRRGGAALLSEPARLLDLLNALRRAHPGPLSAKIRIGLKDSAEFPELLETLKWAPLDFVTIHARPRSAKHSGPIALDCLTLAVATLPYPVIGNGGIWNSTSALTMLKKSGVRGLMCGSGALANPFLFQDLRSVLAGQPEPTHTTTELAAYLKKLLGRLRQYYHTEATGVAVFKELSSWLRRNPLLGEEYFQNIKLLKSWEQLALALQNLEESCR